jgi:lysine 2,3-aminomutase
MSHFNHPNEVTAEAAAGLEKLVDNGVPVMNQMVLLNGVNNHPALVQALNRRLLFFRVKPY